MGRGLTNEYFKVMNDNYVEGTLTCLSPETIKRKITTEFPLVLNIEPTNDCNAYCFYCPRRTMIKSQGVRYMSLENYKNMIDQVAGNQLIMLNLHKDGEPLLHEQLPEMVEYAGKKEASQTIHLNTNGILINTAVGRGIVERGIDDITISIDAAKEETYRRIKKVKGLAELEANIKSVIDFKNRINSHTIIRVKINEFEGVEKEEVELFREKWEFVADEVQVSGIHNWSGAIEGLEITDEQSDERFPCAQPWYQLAINSNMKVSLCNVDWDYSGIVGDAANESIKSIWNGTSMKKIRNAHIKGIWNQPKNCEKCVFWVSFGNIRDYLKTRKEFL